MALVAVLIIINAFFVAGEFAIVSVERSSVERRALDGDRTANRILRSLRNLSFELSGAQLGITVTSLILGAIAEPTIASLIAPLVDWLPFLAASSAAAVALTVAFILTTGSQMVFGELLPKNLAISRPYFSAVWFGVPMQYANRALRPLILFLNRSADWTVRRIGIEPRAELAGVRSMEELELMIRSSGDEGWLDDTELELLTKALAFTENAAGDAMIPRVNVVAMERHQSVVELRQLSVTTGHSRFPIYDHVLDTVIGVAHIKDTLGVADSELSITEVSAIAQPTLEVPETASLEFVLGELRTNGKGMAIVVDEYGGTAGIITLEDLLEEIFGDIEDEYDLDPEPGDQPDGVATISGLLHRHEVDELIGYEWPDGRYETLGGFLIARHGRFPVVGDVISAEPFAFEVTEMDGLRVDQVRVTRIRGQAKP